MPKIAYWTDIADDFRDGLVLGNGASIAFDQRFTYKSLREEAVDRGLVSRDVQKVFDHLGTTDFELVLRVLWHAQHVNAALRIAETRTSGAYLSVKKALIRVVREIHPTFQEVEERLSRAASFMGHFDTVLSLNYDVLVYWAMQLANRESPNRFKDCFVDAAFDSDWKRFKEPYGGNALATLVFYPHGNIVLGADVTGVERKVHTRSLTNLLESVFDSWDEGRLSPVFVSEGTSLQKRASIRRSRYLTTVLDEVLPDMGESVVFHGWSIGQQDSHLLSGIRQGDVGRLAFSVDAQSRKLESVCRRALERLGKFFPGAEVVFYDRQSAGCWITH